MDEHLITQKQSPRWLDFTLNLKFDNIFSGLKITIVFFHKMTPVLSYKNMHYKEILIHKKFFLGGFRS